MVDFKDYTRKMERTLEVLQEEFGAVRAGRANARVLDRISVEYYGSETPIGHPSPRRIPVRWSSSPGTTACCAPLKRPSSRVIWASIPRTTAASSASIFPCLRRSAARS